MSDKSNRHAVLFFFAISEKKVAAKFCNHLSQFFLVRALSEDKKPILIRLQVSNRAQDSRVSGSD